MIIGGAVDIIVILILLFSVILGFFRGFFGETLRLFCWIGSAFATYYTYLNFPWLLPNLDPFIMVSILFVGFLILFKILQLLIEQITKTKGFKVIDQPLGLAFGILRAIVLIFLFKPVLDTFKIESKFLTYTQDHLHSLPYVKTTEEYLHNKFKETLEKVDQEFKKRETQSK